ncbi:MAG TPA: DAK2 domain-containing protein, partial [Limnochordales bacterium]
MAPRRLTAEQLQKIVAAGAAYLDARKETVNALNVFPVPDGDTGTNMARTLAAAQRELGDVAGLTLGEAAQRMARGALLGARGNSGVILSQFLRGFAQGMAEHETAGPRELAAALTAATETAYRAVIKPVEGTMLTVGRGASKAAERAAAAGMDLEGVLAAAVEGAREALARTPSLLPVLARAGVVDAGGQGFVYFLEGMLAAVRGEAV